jgi:hypothetical protein
VLEIRRQRANASELSVHGLAAAALGGSIDLFGESVADPLQADRLAEDYGTLAGRLARLRTAPFSQSTARTSGSISPARRCSGNSSGSPRRFRTTDASSCARTRPTGCA